MKKCLFCAEDMVVEILLMAMKPVAVLSLPVSE
jgi:hypothetical protein